MSAQRHPRYSTHGGRKDYTNKNKAARGQKKPALSCGREVARSAAQARKFGATAGGKWQERNRGSEKEAKRKSVKNKKIALCRWAALAAPPVAQWPPSLLGKKQATQGVPTASPLPSQRATGDSLARPIIIEPKRTAGLKSGSTRQPLTHMIPRKPCWLTYNDGPRAQPGRLWGLFPSGTSPF